MGPGHRLLVRDDRSSDGTLPLLRRLASRESGRIVILNDLAREGKRGQAPFVRSTLRAVPANGACPLFPRLGACRTFGELLEDSDADYMALCDQDDVWLPGRIAKPLERVRAVEREQGAATPILAHTDLAVVDENLDTIAPSFWAYRHLDPYRGSELNRLLVQNVVTGCTTIINRALARLACPIPESVPMHDWWLALVASAFGRIETVPEATVLYRQHGNNSVGAICHDWRYVLRLTREVLFRGAVTTCLQRAQQQAVRC